MTEDDLIRELSGALFLPADALARAVGHPERIAGPVLSLLEAAAAGATLSDAEANLLYWGVHVLGAARDTRAFAPLLRLFARDDACIAGALGEDYTTTAAALAASTFDGDAESLLAAIARADTQGLLRMDLFHALALLTADGRIDAAATAAFLLRFDDARLAGPGSEAWQGWEDAVVLLGHADLADRARAARADGRNPGHITRWESSAAILAVARARPGDRRRFEEIGVHYLGDLREDLAHTSETAAFAGPGGEDGEAPEPERNPYRAVGRNDPCPCGSGRKFKKCCLDKVGRGMAALPPLPPPR
ncbi:hypothetical protein OPKNFCMD_0888 [Methylobacterium crusticola]|uniref:DUF1186 domain-containing protein n=1 Tax=Methylobacterium crusticola TaxID=1697972 RepID=A0ABQ4QUB5_9HYPH|nr:SEC-C metal-binding domain-containing protein [Methylobacterium crusticola]GJD48172.1 hypothetical protein OPKNFCMD_0888 [Methylobacterium crusticola]